MDAPDWQRTFRFAAHTTLGVGGPARGYLRAGGADELRAALAAADAEDAPVLVVGGGSNLLVADEGYDGYVVGVGDERCRVTREGGTLRIEAGAGARWDDVVRASVEAGAGGLACLSGIPGDCGAAPIQNIGAYGVELSDCLTRIRALDRRDGSVVELRADELALGYRTSRLKAAEPERWIVLSLDLELDADAPPPLRYAELERRASDELAVADARSVRELVLRIRAEKGMVLDAGDGDTRSAGSFFTNPIVTEDAAERVRARAENLDDSGRTMPSWPTDDGRVKLSAAWCIERAGHRRGETLGRAALSTRHVLALCNPGGDASAAELLALARRIRDDVDERLAVGLRPEPRLVGFTDEALGPFAGGD